MTAVETMREKELQVLQQRLLESEATVKALLSGEIDAVVDSRTSSPVLLFQAQHALRESVERYRILFEKSPMPKWLFDVKTLRFLAVNDSAVRHYGYTRDEFLRMTIMEIRPPGDRESLARELADGQGRDGAGKRLGRHQKKDGTVIDVEVTGHTFPLEDRVTRLIVAQDITERRRTEETLRASEERVRLLLDSTAQGIYGIDLQSRCTLANSACLRMLGYAHERELLGRSMHELIHHTRADGSHYPAAECTVSEAGLRGEGAALDDEILWRKDGSHFPAELRSFPLRRAGVRVGAVVSLTDITARKHAEETLRWLGAIVESSWDAIVGIDPAGKVTSWNPGAERLYGYSADEMLGQPVALISGESGDDRVGRVLAGEELRDFETTYRRKDGSRVEVSLSLSIIRDTSGKVLGVSGMSRDITQRRAAEGQLQLLHNIVVAAGDATTRDATLLLVLRLFCRATGVPVANAWVIGASGRLENHGQWSRPEDRQRCRRLVDGWTFEKGSGLPGRVWATQIPAWLESLEADPAFSRSAIAAELGFHAALAVPILAGDELVAVVEAFLPASDQITSLVGLLSAVGSQLGSVLHRRRAEEALRKSEEQLRQAQKMEAIGQLTGGVAHDFNNLLSVILSYSALLADEMTPDDPRRSDLLEIKTAGERAAALTRQLLAFSRQQVLQPRIVDLNQVVAGMEKMLRRLIGEDLEFTVLPASSPVRVSVDPGQMEQVIMNLAVNARDAMPTGGRLTIELGFIELDLAFAREHAGIEAGPHAMIAVSDTGCGMDAETQRHVFEPFFTTKERGKGTGLGLSTVFGIVRQSAGTVWLYSEPGRGTVFKVYLPIAASGAAQPAPPPAETSLRGGSETILLVEDEEGVRKLVRAILQRSGYRVLEATDGVEALRIATSHAAIDLLLTDVVMPNMGGAETASRLRQLQPGLKLLYMSGYTDNAVVLHGVLRSEVAFVQKPITPAALLLKVREVLDSR